MAFGDIRGTLQVAVNSVVNPTNLTGSVAVQPGDLVFVAWGEQTAPTSTAVSGNAGSITFAATQAALDAGTVSGRAWWGLVTASGTLTQISVTATATTNNASAVAVVFEGPFTASPLDANPTIVEDIASPFTAPSSGTLAQADELIVSWSVNGVAGAWTATSPNVNRIELATQAILTTRIGSWVVSATTAVAPAWTGTNPTDSVLGTNSFRKDLTAVPDVVQRPFERLWIKDYKDFKLKKFGAALAAALAVSSPPVVPEAPVEPAISFAQADTIIPRRVSRLYPLPQAAPFVENIGAGVLSVTGSTDAAFVSPAVAEVSFAAADTIIPYRRSRLYPLLQAPIVAENIGAGALAVTGSTNPAFVGTAVKDTVLQIAGSTVPAFVGEYIVPIVSGTSPDLQIVRQRYRARGLRAALQPSLQQPTPVVAAQAGALAIVGSTVPSFVGDTIVPIVSNTANDHLIRVRWRARGLRTANIPSLQQPVPVVFVAGSGALAIVGSTTLDLRGASTAAGDLDIDGATAVTFVGQAIAAPVVLSGTDAEHIIRARWRARGLRAALQRSFHLAPALVLQAGEGVLSISGSTSPLFTGRATAAAVFATTGSTTVSWAGGARIAGALQITGATDVAFVGQRLETIAAALTIIGATQVSFSTTPIRPPTIARARSVQFHPMRRAQEHPTRTAAGTSKRRWDTS